MDGAVTEETLMAKKKGGLSGYAIDFVGRNITMESLMGNKPIDPQMMTRKLWAYIRREGLARTSLRSGASRRTQMPTHKGWPLVVSSQKTVFKAALTRALEQGESSTVEFKEALRWDHRQDAGTKPSVAEAAAIKTIAGFLNNKPGGTLLIGIADDKRTVGLDQDYLSLRRSGGREQSDADRFQRHLRDLVAAKIPRDISNQCIETAIVPHEEKDVCVVRVSPSPTPIYIDEAFYLRVGPATQKLNMEETVAFCRKRWPRGT
jgi:schlafen family protein